MVVSVAQGSLSEIQRSVRDYLRTGGSIGGVLLIWLALLAVVVLVHVLTRQLRRRDRTVPSNDPKRLFRGLLRKLDLSPPEQRLLALVAKDLQLEHPSTILLSPALFDRSIARWRGGRQRAEHVAELAAHARSVLFPESS